MKRLFCFAISVALCLSLCSCGVSNSKNNFVGTYELNGVWSLRACVSGPYNGVQNCQRIEQLIGKWTLVLNSDGTGIKTFEITNMDTDWTLMYPDQVKEMGTEIVSWNTDGQYINITFKGKTYSDPNDPLHGWNDTPRDTNYTNTYELKGAQLINVDNSLGLGNYTKID